VTPHDPAFIELNVVVQEIRKDVAEIKTQTTRTNGRVTALELQKAVDAALDAERAAALARDADAKARALATQSVEQAKALALSGRRQWMVNAAIAACSAGVGVAGVLLTHSM
jgi:hypothetical protein